MNFYDTCALLNMQEDAFLHGRFYISSITLRELEDIKTSQHKDEEGAQSDKVADGASWTLRSGYPDHET